MDLQLAVYAGVVLFVAYLGRSIAGFGSGLIAVPLLTLAAPVPLGVPLGVALDYIGSASQGLPKRRRIAWKEQLILMPFMLASIGLGLLVLRAIPTSVPGKLLGAL
jgi:uncharacterized membrane protein YfcA